MKAIVCQLFFAVVLMCSTAGAGTLYPSFHNPIPMDMMPLPNPPYAFAGAYIDAVDSGNTVPWKVSLTVSKVALYFNEDAGLFLGNGIPLTPPATFQVVAPFSVYGLPDDFVVQSVSADFQWFSSTTHQLYQVPEPPAGLLGSVGAVLIVVGLTWRFLVANRTT